MFLVPSNQRSRLKVMDTFKKILDDVDEVDLTPMIDVTFLLLNLFHGNYHDQAT